MGVEARVDVLLQVRQLERRAAQVGGRAVLLPEQGRGPHQNQRQR